MSLEVVSHYLAQSVVAATAKSSEQSLKSLENQEGFSLTLLHVVASERLPMSTRLAGSLFFKNFIRRRWVNENGEHLLSPKDVELVKKEIVVLMIQLSGNLQAQIGESIAVIADSDFPHNWPTLLDDLVSRLSIDDMITNKGVLTVAHSIFKRWRPLFRSDELFLEIKLVLDRFAGPFLEMLKAIDGKIETTTDVGSLRILFEVLHLLVKLCYDLNCQDIPEFFEDNMHICMSIMHKYLSYQNVELEDPEEDHESSILTKVKSSIAELVQLYTSRYEDVFGPMISEFIQTTWNLLVSLTYQPKYDILVTKCLSFLTAVARIPRYFELFNNESVISNITDQIILPNVTLREADEELFEDDPIEYIRRDLEGSDSDTRRRACTDFLKELKEKNESLLTNIVLIHIKSFFEKYKTDPTKNWKYKDLCVYLYTSLAINGNKTSIGVTSVNSMLNVVDFFKDEIIPDLTNATIAHPILTVDAIKYIYTFRNQLNKDQLLELLPILGQFLHSSDYVIYTYSAVTIERILSMRESITSKKLIFNKNDIMSHSALLLTNLFGIIMRQNKSPEKLAENEYLMKAIHRILLISEDAIRNNSFEVLRKLIDIITIISKNPSNPRFNHFTFEAISVVIKFNHDNLNAIIDSVMPIFLEILSQDIHEFISYIFQIISYALEQLPVGADIPNQVKQLYQPLLSPTVWELKGCIPAVTRLLKDIIKQDSTNAYPDLVPVLGVFQRLIASKAFDNHGFELLEYIMLYTPMEKMQPYLKQIAVLLLQRLQNSRTEKYIKKFTVFLAILSYKINSDFVIQFIDEVQPGLFGQVWQSFVIPTLPTIGNLLDRKIALVGTLNTITTGAIISSTYQNLIVPTLESIASTLKSESILLNTKNDFTDLEASEEISTFGSSFSKLITIQEQPFDPLPDIDLIQGLNVHIINIIRNLNPSVVQNLSNETKQKILT